MAKRFHNLAGWVRDLRQVHSERPEGDGDVDTLWNEFVNFVEYALEEIEGPGQSEDAEDGDTDAQDELGGDGLQGGDADGERRRGHDARSQDRGTAASELDAILDGVAGAQRARAIAELDALRRDAVAGALALSGGKRKLNGASKA